MNYNNYYYYSYNNLLNFKRFKSRTSSLIRITLEIKSGSMNLVAKLFQPKNLTSRCWVEIACILELNDTFSHVTR